MFDLEKFKTGEYYVHLPTKEMYNEVMEYLEENNVRWLGRENPTETNFWFKCGEEMSIAYNIGLVYGPKGIMKALGKEKMNLKGETNMNEKMKRDLVKLLFEKEYSDYERGGMYSYKGRIITDYVHRTARFIDFIDKIKDEYGISGHEVADVIIKEFDLEEYREEE